MRHERESARAESQKNVWKAREIHPPPSTAHSPTITIFWSQTSSSTMKTFTMISTAFFATASAFAPKTNVAFRHGARAFSRSSVAMMAGNPKGKSKICSDMILSMPNQSVRKTQHSLLAFSCSSIFWHGSWWWRAWKNHLWTSCRCCSQDGREFCKLVCWYQNIRI